MRLTRPGPGPSLREVRAGAEADVTEELCSLPQACPRGAQEHLPSQGAVLPTAGGLWSSAIAMETINALQTRL